MSYELDTDEWRAEEKELQLSQEKELFYANWSRSDGIWKSPSGLSYI